MTRAAQQNGSQLRAALRRAVLRVAPDQARRKIQAARAQQDVDWFPLPDGQAELRMRADATDVLAVEAAVRAAAARLGLADQAAGVERTAGQRRVAALVALVAGAITPQQRARAVINVTVDLPTVLGLADNPAHLSGYGPLPASVARDLAADGAWRRLIHEPLTGHLLDLGRIRYRPSARLAEYIRLRDQTCIFPSCSRRADYCDLDHGVPYRRDGTGGATDRPNLHPLCASHHRVKHETGWTLQTSETGPPTWISPLGRRYPVNPYDHRPEAPPEFETEPDYQPIEPGDEPIDSVIDDPSPLYAVCA